MESIQIVWKHGGGHVLLAGSFNQWQAVPMKLNNGFWEETLSLSSGQYHYKFIVDGNWKYDHQKTIVDDGCGNVNNLLIVGNVLESQSKSGYTTVPAGKKPEENKKQVQQQKPQENKAQGKPQENKTKPGQEKGKTEEKKKEDPKAQGKPQDKAKPGQDKAKPGQDKGKPEEKKKDSKQENKQVAKDKKPEMDPARLVGHWEKIQVATITGKESWWVYVKTDDDPAKFPLRRRIPPDCVHCGSKVLVEDEVFSRYGVEWQPLCIKCYSNGNNVSLITGKQKPSSKPVCYFCLETEEVKSDICNHCQEYISRQQANFGRTKNEALTSLYYFQEGLRNSRKSLPQH